MFHDRFRRFPEWMRLTGLTLLLSFCLLISGTLTTARVHAQQATTTTITDCSSDAQLQSAVANAASGGTIRFGCGGDIKVTKTLTISKNLTLDGRGWNVTLDGQDSTRVLNVTSGANFTLNTLTVAHGNAANSGTSIKVGGGLLNTGTVTINNSTFTNNATIGLLNTGTVTMSSSTFSNNLAGGLFNNGTVTMSFSTFTYNSANIGGGLLNNGGTVGINYSTFTYNKVSNSGGGLYSLGGTVNISNSAFASNKASNLGGGLYNQAGTVSISNSSFSSNSAITGGGGLLSFGEGTVNINYSTFFNNSTESFGGGLLNTGGAVKNSKVNISNSTFFGNLANLGGGLVNADILTISNSTFVYNQANFNNGNSADSGGGLYNSGTASISDSTFASNSAKQGGGLDNVSTVSISASIFANNSGGNCTNGTTSDKGYNLTSDSTCGFTARTSRRNIDPKLVSTLANNGGPTPTLALQQGSPAIDGIPAANCPATDQRGITRPDGGENACDIGSYEAN